MKPSISLIPAVLALVMVVAAFPTSGIGAPIHDEICNFPGSAPAEQLENYACMVTGMDGKTCTVYLDSTVTCPARTSSYYKDYSDVPQDQWGHIVDIDRGVGVCVLLDTRDVSCDKDDGITAQTWRTTTHNIRDMAVVSRGACVIRDTGEVACGRENNWTVKMHASHGTPVAIDVETDGDTRGCAVTTNGMIYCGSAKEDAPDWSLVYTRGDAVSVETTYSDWCAITESTQVTCGKVPGCGMAPTFCYRPPFEHDAVGAAGVEVGISWVCVLTVQGNIDCESPANLWKPDDRTLFDVAAIDGGSLTLCWVLISGESDCQKP